MPTPKSIEELKRVMGLFSYYSKWIRDFSTKLHPLVQSKRFPLSPEAVQSFEALKREIEKATLTVIDDEETFIVETDASNCAIAATLNQNKRPVAFFSRTLSASEQRHSSIEKEAYAIIEALRRWRHYLLGQHFKLITDQRSVVFMFNQKASGKVKNEKIMRWRMELSPFSFDIVYRPGTCNPAADALSRISVCSAVSSHQSIGLYQIHDALGHPGVTRLTHFIRSRNLPFSIDEIKETLRSCKILL